MPQSPYPPSTAGLQSFPLHVMLAPIPVACFAGALITDLVYWQTANMQWANFSAWLLAVGLVVAVVAVIAGLLDYLFRRRIRPLQDGSVHVLGYAIAIVLAIFNSFIHSRDAYTSVVPTGVALSALTVLVLAATGWHGWWLVHRHGANVPPRVQP